MTDKLTPGKPPAEADQAQSEAIAIAKILDAVERTITGWPAIRRKRLLRQLGITL